MTDTSTFWRYVLICALVSAVCRLLPLLVKVERLSAGTHAFIERLGKYTSVAMLVSLLAGSLHPLANAHSSSLPWAGAVALAWLLGLSRLPSYYTFFIALGVYALLIVN
ncbi:AzlD domain-containing protein [Pseudomonas sp. H9]|uniref:AzlD domain-containing protein n=1 Tax=Pseudomonas sp. H9 TaxID=483968 RepID=UPI001057A9E6|nr:AzlD domain-containing protein [Pseudomonas sp. H9]TDF83731.1 hypothetical protein E1573_08185 [Pseudomonas sp. H9]